MGWNITGRPNVAITGDTAIRATMDIAGFRRNHKTKQPDIDVRHAETIGNENERKSPLELGHSGSHQRNVRRRRSLSSLYVR